MLYSVLFFRQVSVPTSWGVIVATDGSAVITVKSDVPVSQVRTCLQQIGASDVTFDMRHLVSVGTLNCIVDYQCVGALYFHYLNGQSGNDALKMLVACFNDRFQIRHIGVNSSYVSDEGVNALLCAFEQNLVPASIQCISLNHNCLTTVSALPLARRCFDKNINLHLINNRIDAVGASHLKSLKVTVIPWSDDRVD